MDLGDRLSEVCVLGARGRVVRRERVRTAQEDLRALFEPMARALVAIEVGTHSPWVSRLLAGIGHEVVVAHPAKVPLIHQNVRKRGRTDAEALARLARVDRELLSPVVHRSAQAQADLQVLRARDALVRARNCSILCGPRSRSTAAACRCVRPARSPARLPDRFPPR